MVLWSLSAARGRCSPHIRLLVEEESSGLYQSRKTLSMTFLREETIVSGGGIRVMMHVTDNPIRLHAQRFRVNNLDKPGRENSAEDSARLT